MFAIANLHKRGEDGSPLLQGVDLKGAPGQLIALLGASGSGKTTLLRCMMMAEAWDEGTLHYAGHELISLGDKGKRLLRKHWAYLPEEPLLEWHRTAVQNVAAAKTPWLLSALGITPRRKHVAAMDLLETMGLLDKARLKAQQLSGGERQRVVLAKALFMGAKVIVADEPVSGLDPHSAKAVLEELRHICAREKLTVVAAMQQTDLAEKYADRIVGLANGKIVVDVVGRRMTSEERKLIYEGASGS